MSEKPFLMADVCSRMYRTASFSSRYRLFGEPEQALWEGERVCLERVRRGDGEELRCNMVIVKGLLKVRILALFAADGTVGRKYAGFEDV